MSHASRTQLAKIRKLIMILMLVATLVAASAISVSAQIGEELLTRPTATSVTVPMVPEVACRIYYEYGTTSGGPYTMQTTPVDVAAEAANSTVITGLTANTRYYYRMQYSTNGGVSYTPRSEYTFHTQRASGSPFSFTVTSDSHVNILLGSATTWANVCDEVAAQTADFHIDLGDTVAMRGLNPGDVAGAEDAYTYQYQFFNRFSHSRAVFLVAGNHEQEEGWHLQGTLTDSLPAIGINAQKKYFPMPVPDGFYTGNATTYAYLSGDQLPEDYYAWTWGDALFVAIDPYLYTTNKPYVSDPGGGENDATGTGDTWDWTLGQTQFNWLKTTLENSTATYKFIFTHQMVSDCSASGQEDYGHGGANTCHIGEWGGYNEDGTTYAWSTKRAGWGADPVHDILVANGVSALFHGHDHQYAYEIKDGVVYQAVPTSGFNNGANGFGIYTTGDGYTISAQPNTGHLLVTVDPEETTVQYFRMDQSSSTYTYTIEGGGVVPSVLGDVNGDSQANSTDALIVLSADVGIDTAAFCPMNCGDVNGDTVVNSTDALIILSFDAGMSVPFPVETGACPSTVTQPAGCP